MEGKCGGDLTGCTCSFSDIYETTQLANGLHQVPHLNYLLEHVSSNFSYSVEYVQGVAFWGVCLIALFLFITLHCLFYSICMCKMVSKSRKSSWEKCHKRPNVCLTVFGVVSFLGIAVCAVGIWSDITQNDTLLNFVNVFKSANNLINTLDTDIKSVPVSEIDRLLGEIDGEIQQLPPDTPNIDQHKQEISRYLSVIQEIKEDVNEVTDKLDKISLGQLDQQMEEGVKYRLIATLLLFSITALLLIISIIYAIKPIARCTGFVFLFLVSFFFCVWWVLGSLAFTADIALADFCIFPNPDAFIQSQVAIDQQYKEESEYLLYCHGCENPFEQFFTSLNSNFQQINATVDDLRNFTAQYKTMYPTLYTNTLQLRLNIIQSFLDLRQIVVYDLNCDDTSSLYALAIADGCYNGLLHFTIETGCAMLLAVVFLVLTAAQCFNACRLVAFFSNKKRTVSTGFEGLSTISPISSTRISAPARVQLDASASGYRNGVVSRDIQVNDQQMLLETSRVHARPNAQMNEYPFITTNSNQGTNNFHAFPSYTDYIFHPDPEMNVSRASSMEDNLHAYFPELASSLPDGEPAYSIY